MFKRNTNRLRIAPARGTHTAEPFEILERRELLSAVSFAAARTAAHHLQRGGGHHQLYQPMFAQAIAPHTASDQAQPYAGQSSPTGSALTPTQIRGAYGMGAVGNSSIIYGGIQGDGTGQTIAIIDAYDYPSAATDLHNFSVQYGLPDAPSFTKVNQLGQASPLPGTDPAGAGAANGNWEMEEALDIEWAHVMAPKAGLVLVECNSSSSFDMIYNLNTHVNGGAAWARSQPGISVVSMSFGFGESAGESSYDPYFTTPAGHQGVTFLASTGDSGTPGGYPAYSPNVVAVGGTELSVGAANSWNNEWGWTGSGGGVSQYESQPAYQKNVVSAFSSTKRTIPDVSLEADPSTGVAIYDSYDFGAATPWNQGLYGGTSLAAPMTAGLIAVANQGRTLAGQDTLNGLTQTLPNIYAMSASNFHDITSGNNGTQAAAGYDTVTGRGTPIGSAFAFSVAGITADSPITSLYLKKDADGTHLDEWINSATPGQGAPTQQRVLSSASSILLNAAAGSDALTLDYSNGNFAAGLTNIAYFASAGGNNAINFVGENGNDGISITTGSIGVSGGFGSTPITISNVANVSFPGGSGGNDSITVLSTPAGGLNLNADAPFGAANIAVNVSGMMTNVNFTSTQHLASLAVQATNSAKLTSSATNAGKLLVVPTLTIAGTGKLDLTNNELVVTNAAAAVRGEIVAGHITSTATGGALGYMDIGNGQTEVRYTLLGDTNLDGKVDVTDLGNLAGSYGAGSGATWVQGDTNYDGKVDVTDLGNLAGNYGGAVV